MNLDQIAKAISNTKVRIGTAYASEATATDKGGKLIIPVFLEVNGSEILVYVSPDATDTAELLEAANEAE